jgi:hypothetical protein
MTTKQKLVVGVGGFSALVALGLVPHVLYWLRERELIAIVDLDTPSERPAGVRPIRSSQLSPGEREALEARRIEVADVIQKRLQAVQELGGMKSVRAIPHIIEMWDRIGARDHYAGREAIVATGQSAIPYLRKVIMGESKDRTGNKRLMAIITCQEMGPEAFDLLPDLIEWYCTKPYYCDHVEDAIVAIGGVDAFRRVDADCDCTEPPIIRVPRPARRPSRGAGSGEDDEE